MSRWCVVTAQRAVDLTQSGCTIGNPVPDDCKSWTFHSALQEATELVAILPFKDI
jgi:hypothetical protein